MFSPAALAGTYNAPASAHDATAEYSTCFKRIAISTLLRSPDDGRSALCRWNSSSSEEYALAFVASVCFGGKRFLTVLKWDPFDWRDDRHDKAGFRKIRYATSPAT